MTTRVEFKPPMKEVKAEYKKAIGNIAGGGKNVGGLFKKAAVFMDRWVQLNFKTSGGKVGGWMPLQLGGRWIKKSKGKRVFDTSAKVLMDTSRLRHSFLPFADNKKAGIGSDLPYSETHHEGKGVPERQITPEKKNIIDDLMRIADVHAKMELKKVRL